MRFLSCFVHLLLLFTFPTVHLYSHTSYSKVDVDILSHQDHLTFDDLPRFDALLQLIDDIENGNLEQSRSKSINLEEIENIVIQLAREGMLPGEAKENAELENDIQSLLEGSFCHNCWFFSSRESYVIAPAIFYGQGELLLCRGWWQKKWEGLKKFIKKHKTAIIIGAAVILTAGAGIVLINAIAQENAKSASTREPPRSQPNKYLPEERSLPPSALTTPTSPAPIHEEDVRLLKETIEQEVIAFKEVLREGQMTETWQQSCKESARFASSFIAHDILNGIDEFCSISADLAAGLKKLAQLALPDSQLLHNGTSPVEDYEKAVAFAHEKIDQLFSTDLAKRYTPEAKAAQRQYAIENNINYMVLPLPAFIKSNVGAVKEIVKDGKKAALLARQLGFTKREIAHLKGGGKLDKTVASTFERVIADPAKIAAIKKIKRAEAILKPYSKNYITEVQVRGLIQQTGLKTFSRPRGIPENFRVMVSKQGGGMKYVHPKNEETYVRVMPGKPHRPNPLQRQPYVTQMKDGKTLDKYGKVVPKSAPEAHIPIEKFNYLELQ